MKGNLPCAEASTPCISQLQGVAAQNNPLLKEVDARIQEIEAKISEAKTANKQSINLSVLTPAVQYLFQGTGATTVSTPVQPGQPAPRPPGFLDRLVGIFTSITGINGLLGAIGVPTFQALTGGNNDAKNRSIAIADLQIKLAQLQRDRAELADVIREKVYQAAFDLDDAKREFQVSQELARGRAALNQLAEVEYRLGQGSTESYLNGSFALQQHNASVFRTWTKLRSGVVRVKLLVLGAEGL
nr:TolC family protein [Trichocoleus sp. FACHB-40]